MPYLLGNNLLLILMLFNCILLFTTSAAGLYISFHIKNYKSVYYFDRLNT